MKELVKIKRHRVQASTTTSTYVYCFIAAKEALSQADHQEGQFYSCMSAGVFSAFTFEAYLNHIGETKVRDWDSLERRLGPREKLILLQQLLHLTIDKSKRPFQTLNDILRLRDSLAHGKTLTSNVDINVSEHMVGSNEYPKADWESLCEHKSVTKMVEDVEKMIREIHKQLNINREPFASPKHSWSSTTEIN
jgi:hypothetical protein